MATKRLRLGGEDITLGYSYIDNSADKNMLFLHGWGANKELMQASFKDCFKDYNHLYVDLFGFGKSSVLPTSYPAGSYEYAMYLNAFITALFTTVLHGRLDAITAHSFGGKLALLLRPSELVLLSTAGIVPKKSGSVRAKIWIAKMLKKYGINATALTNRLRSKDMHALPEALYGTFKRVIDEDFSELYSSSSGCVIWGRHDRALPLYVGEIEARLMGVGLEVVAGDHFFFLNRRKGDGSIEQNAKKIEALFYASRHVKNKGHVERGAIEGIYHIEAGGKSKMDSTHLGAQGVESGIDSTLKAGETQAGVESKVDSTLQADETQANMQGAQGVRGVASKPHSTPKASVDKTPTTYHILFTGRVQGVYFRQGVKEYADSHSATGFVRNLSDGGVELLINIANLDALLSTLNARYDIKTTSIIKLSMIQYENFTIRI